MWKKCDKFHFLQFCGHFVPFCTVAINLAGALNDETDDTDLKLKAWIQGKPLICKTSLKLTVKFWKTSLKFNVKICQAPPSFPRSWIRHRSLLSILFLWTSFPMLPHQWASRSSDYTCSHIRPLIIDKTTPNMDCEEILTAKIVARRLD
jgi:hypothetical protein